jgi:RNA polymerase-binding transcription factor DksA
MGTFLQGSKLNSAIEDIFEESVENLVLISPFIKLHDRFRDILIKHKDKPRLKIVIVFGKNENNIAKSFSNEEFEFLKEFPNIQIKYNHRLHAKYYANEKSAILSSMNLYTYSQDNNIEFGILTKASLFGSLTSNFTGENLDKDAFEYFKHVVDTSDLLYHRKPVFEEKFMNKKYIESTTEVDDLSTRLSEKTIKKIKKKKVSSAESIKEEPGYCIRTGEKIPFNPKKPLSNKAFKQWSKYEDDKYEEKYCHYSGEPSKGETTVAKPILRKNWKKAMN